ncbi:MAG TPA: PAS domain-containing sensor histidine kinase [Usitatibacter sp.]|nr:PAS domain-containing sensor histidine kinase [Usitatibacter sp.]
MNAPERVGPWLHLLAQQAQELAVIFLDVEGNVTWWSPGAERIFGYTAEEVLGKPSCFMFTPHDTERGIPEHEIEAAMRDNPAEDDRWQQRKDGSRFWASGIMCGLRDEAGTLVGFGKILRNRTDAREQLETMRNRVAALEEADRLQDAFLSTLSHELANPLGPLINAARIIRQAAPPGDDVEYALRVIDRQTQLLRTLVSDLLEFSRAGAGKIELKRVRCSLHDVIDACANDCRPLIEERRHQLHVILPRAPIFVVADPERLHQVFVNLLTNAAKYTPPGGRISLKATTEGDEAAVRVEDSGVGIPHEMLPKIFELFTQVETSRPMARGGLGIGLALVKELVEMHGGSVQVMSEGTGKGSEFTVRLPVAPEEVVSIVDGAVSPHSRGH